MMADFDPDAFLKSTPDAPASGGFDPDAFLKETAPAPSLHGRERQHAYLQSLKEGEPDQPAGQAAAGPDTTGEAHSAEQLAQEWSQIGKGALKGPPASLSGGLLGDTESLGRSIVGAKPDTFFPTTTEGGYLGPKGLDVMAPAANPQEAAGMTIGSLVGPGAPLKALRALKVADKAAEIAEAPTVTKFAPFGAKKVPEPPPELPVAPEGAPTPIVRGDSGARLLPADTPHIPEPIDPLAARRSAGAAGESPLADISHEAIDKAKKILAEEGWTPWTRDARLEEMSQHQTLGEISPNTEAYMGAVASDPGMGKTEIMNTLGTRAREANARLSNIFDTHFGEAEDLAQLQRSREIDRSKAASPLYQKFRDLPIQPTPELKELIPRLQTAGAFQEAKFIADLKGIPWNRNFFTTGPQKAFPTAESWDLVKRALDSKIEGSFNSFGKPTLRTKLFTELKQNLVNAIDNHPNPEVAGVWKQARKTFADSMQIDEAERLGQKFFNIDKNELPFITAGYSDAQMAALRRSVRNQLENQLGNPGRTELPVMKKILSPNNQKKLEWILPEGETPKLTRSIEHEYEMHGAPQRVYQQSPTQFRQQAYEKLHGKKMSLSEMATTAAGAVAHPVYAAGKIAAKAGFDRLEKASLAKKEKMNEDLSKIFTLQGPERDAVVRYLTEPSGRQSGGRVKRATGGLIHPTGAAFHATADSVLRAMRNAKKKESVK